MPLLIFIYVRSDRLYIQTNVPVTRSVGFARAAERVRVLTLLFDEYSLYTHQKNYLIW